MLEVTVESVIPDNTAYTALVALRELGCDWLRDIERAEGMLLSLEDTATSGEIIEKIAHAEVIFNPNKHRLYYREVGPAHAGPSTTGLELVVTDREDDTAVLARLLRETFGLRDLRSTARFVVWRLGDGATRSQVEDAAAKLLVNPISQAGRIAPRPARSAWAPTARPETVA